MLQLLLIKESRSWTQDLYVSLRNSPECQEVTYAIDRCCERQQDAGEPPLDPDFPKAMLAEAEKIKAGGGETK